MTLEEMNEDLNRTNKDIERLSNIVLNLSQFIEDSGGENRAFLKLDLMRFEVLLGDGQRLLSKIMDTIEIRKREKINGN